MENAGRGSGARRQPLPHVSSGPAPACAQQPCGMAWAAAAADDEGLRILLIQRRPAAMSPGQRHCSLPGAWRAPARVSLARSLHLLPLAVLQPVRNDAVSGPLPPFAPGPGSEQGAGRRMESARGEGRNRRKHPEAPPAGRAGPPPLPPPAARAGGVRARGQGEGGGTRAGGASSLLGSPRAGVPRTALPRGRAAPESGGDAPALPLRRERKLRDLLRDLRRLPQRKANSN